MLGYIFKASIFRQNVKRMGNSLSIRGFGFVNSWTKAYGMVLAAEKELHKRTFDNMKNPASGRSLLESQKGGQYFDKVAHEGLIESDFIEYWDIHPLTRRCISILHDMDSFATYSAARGSGLSEEDARIEVGKTHPVWGVTSEKHSSWPPQHRPLPPELRFRFGRALESNGPEWLYSGVEGFGSVNAFVRHSIRNGSM